MNESFYYSTLKEKPEYFEQTLKLIENSLHYKEDNKFSVDFAPLMTKENHHQCHIMVDTVSKTVIGHIGVLKKNLMVNGVPFPVALIGGVCIAERHRGQGLFSKLMNHVLNTHNESVGMFMLWTGDHQLYRKFDFHLCIEQVEVKKTKAESTHYIKTHYSDLNTAEKAQVRRLYQKHIIDFCVSFERTENDWKNLELITSTDLYIRRQNNNIVGYFFMNKGQDLAGIVHEIASDTSYDDVSNYGNVWVTPAHRVSGEEFETQFASLVKIANIDLFRRMIFKYTQEKILIIKTDGEDISFEFDKRIFTIPTQRFLTGLWGPNTFTEFNFQTKPLYVSGLDSI
ncbi:MAG: GNAT family N-acetyltransferase [Bacteriovoracaceae bacterium]|nr:GNAT family N-acetyltransferase [Bacteriovoracaceae bacterium]